MRPSALPPRGRACSCWNAPRSPDGTTALAGGHFYLGGGTAVQQATGHADSAEEMYKYLVAMSREPEHDKIRAYCEGSVEHFNWLEDLGITFERSYYPQKAVIQPNTEGLMYTGNEKVWPFKDIAAPAPRGHKVPVPGDTQGAAMVIDLLLKRADELGVQIRYETGATQPGARRRRRGRSGCRWKHFADTGAIRAKAVVIAAGGFVMNPEMVAEYTPNWPRSRSYSATPTTTVSASDWACRPVVPPSTWIRRSSPPRSTRRRSCSPASSSTSSASGSSPRTPTTPAHRVS